MDNLWFFYLIDW